MSRRSKKKTQHELRITERKIVEENLEKRIRSWSAVYGGTYPLPILEFLVSRIGVELESAADQEEESRESEFYNPASYIVGVTNGEFYYSLYRTLERMLKEPEFEIESLPFPDQQILAAAVDLAIIIFMDYVKMDEREMLVSDAPAMWACHYWLRKRAGEPVWSTDSGEEVESLDLNDLSQDEWEMITSEIQEHFVPDPDVEFVDLALGDAQPHWPSPQEYRKAKGWLLEWFSSASR
jgi:hypothetical protein